MSEKQRRYLFRLLAERNIVGKQAENYLKKALNPLSFFRKVA
jgi:hypothetical protein